MTELLIPTEPTTRTTTGYTVLARRYRSTTFDEVVGQEPIARTLANAIERGRTAHAYLFCGTRGVGKTSMARILAKVLNATEDLTEQDAIAAAILRGEDLDVIEIDAASHTGVDNVRDLIANAALRPARSPYKIYIIDEVHMLSKSAFNALLKIMEEPPSHVKFILCTTEPTKVLATIQSRCQRFDFRNIPAKKIAGHLHEVLKQEQIEAEDQVVAEIARQATGSMRDALSLLDRLIAAGEGALTIDVLEATLGAPDHAIVARIVDGIVAADPKATLAEAAELLNRGTSLEQAVDVLAEHFRNVLVIAACGEDSELVELFGEAREAAQRHAQHLDPPAIVHLIALCEATARNIRLSSTPRALFDAMLVRLALTEQLVSIPSILSGSDAGGPAQKKNPIVKTAAPDAAPGANGPRSERSGRAEMEAVRDVPLVARAIEIFNAKVVGVREQTEGEKDSEHV